MYLFLLLQVIGKRCLMFWTNIRPSRKTNNSVHHINSILILAFQIQTLVFGTPNLHPKIDTPKDLHHIYTSLINSPNLTCCGPKPIYNTITFLLIRYAIFFSHSYWVPPHLNVRVIASNNYIKILQIWRILKCSSRMKN